MKRRFLWLAGILAISSVAMAGTAYADAPKFHSATSTVTSSGALSVSFDERGLGNANVDYLLSADASATYACINRGGKNPSAANKRTFNAEVNQGASFQSKNGRVRATMTAGPPSAGGFTCPPGQRLVLAGVSYTNITLTDTTNGVTTSVPDASRTFFAV
jgi:hypothetical protein